MHVIMQKNQFHTFGDHLATNCGVGPAVGLHLFVELREGVAGHRLTAFGSQQPVEVLDHVLAIELGSLPLRHQHAPALHHLHIFFWYHIALYSF